MSQLPKVTTTKVSITKVTTTKVTITKVTITKVTSTKVTSKVTIRSFTKWDGSKEISRAAFVTFSRQASSAAQKIVSSKTFCKDAASQEFCSIN